MPRDAYPHPAPHDPAGLVNHTHRRPLETNVQSCKHPHRCSPSFARGITSGKGRLPAGEPQPNVWDVLGRISESKPAKVVLGRTTISLWEVSYQRENNLDRHAFTQQPGNHGHVCCRIC